MQEGEQPPSANSQSIGAKGDRDRTMTAQLRPAQGAMENGKLTEHKQTKIQKPKTYKQNRWQNDLKKSYT